MSEADLLDALERENAHLRIVAQKVSCPYGHRRDGGCELGYPGCACMDDLLAMTAWCPEEEDKAAVRLGARAQRAEALLVKAAGALTTIGRIARSDGGRNFDDCVRDLGHIDDECRAFHASMSVD